MSGNVREWCHDWYLNTYYQGGSMTNPTGPGSGTYRVLRGGSWNSSDGYCRSADRIYYNPDYAGYNFGFRIVRTP